MGHISDRDLREPRLSGEPSPVGAFERMAVESSATRLVSARRHGTNTSWQYGYEAGMHVAFYDLVFECLASDALFWSGLRVRFNRNDLPDFEPGKFHLTASLHPPSFH